MSVATDILVVLQFFLSLAVCFNEGKEPMSFPKNISLLLLSFLTVTSSCKTVKNQDREVSEEKGIIHDTLNPRLARNSDTPWVEWQWYYGARDDTGASNG